MLRIVLVLALALPPLLRAAESSEAVVDLENEAKILKQLEPTVRRMDFVRLRILETSVLMTLRSLAEKGPSHAQTIRYYQQQVITFRYSTTYFSLIQTDNTAPLIKELLGLNDRITRRIGFDESSFSQVTGHVFSQMYRLFLQLKETGTLPPALQSKMNSLIPGMGRLIAIAEKGDSPRTFDVARPIYREIVGLYEEFDKLGSSHAAFEVIIEIQALNEFYGEFGK